MPPASLKAPPYVTSWVPPLSNTVPMVVPLSNTSSVPPLLTTV